MTLILKDHDLVYFPVPKIACTSLKRAFHRVNEGVDFEPVMRDGVAVRHVHHLYPSRYFFEVDWSAIRGRATLTVVRDPVERLISAFQNRVSDKDDLSDIPLKARIFLFSIGLSRQPSADEFFENLDIYRNLSRSIRRHTDSIAAFLGPDLRRYDHVFAIKDIDKLTAQVSERIGGPFRVPHEQKTAAPRIRFGDLSRKARRIVLAACAGDYALLRDHYAPPPMP